MSVPNLNLLRTLHVLLDECHVTRTAERLHITQSAVSRQLTQLREIFSDPLFVREGNRLLPTPRALSLQDKITSLLTDCDLVFEPEQFSPHNWRGKIVLSSSDYVAQYIFPDIVELLTLQAPLLDVSYQLWSPNYTDQLADLDIQLVSTMAPNIPAGLSGIQIGSDRAVCVMSATHPLANTKLDLTVQDFVAYNHISVNGGGDKDSFVDVELRTLGCRRHIQTTVPFFGSALSIVSRTEMFLVIPEHIAVTMQDFYNIVYKPLPFPSVLNQYWLLWHPKYNNELSHQWLREHVLTLMKGSLYSMGK
ncbi:LysR family transcriptional regulator [Photobacterium angustum]|uniref:LysR family transcriptional regulator n=1 Tax=Photobacterium angustum TaxID=661 RepID=A0A855SF65_PHOAN|nr:LysR family transcriptional regulator [Photobacterium angustum]KJF80113.1 transcriptional regulator [Photobacterium damselae subsp. damselae]KJG00379.1 transcriptional regulator [Photobacterium angustum]KJG15457.1 transcriptional regulator [Photobacterium angustum]KJG20020.1 transcriptional regulator [Photobacterium angustum]KJG27642.1 transcriptional regulator [Photobacterium angustum]